MNKNFLNIILVGVAFLLIFTGFQGCGLIQETVLQSARNESDIIEHAGYYSLSVIYASFTLCNFLAPPIVGLLGPRLSMMLGGSTYALFLASFLVLHTWILFLASVVLGLGAAIIWTAQGKFITLNSTEQTMGRNSGIVWAIFQGSFLLGSLFLFIEFRGKTSIDSHTRFVVYLCFTCLSVSGLLLMLLLRQTVAPTSARSDTDLLVNDCAVLTDDATVDVASEKHSSDIKSGGPWTSVETFKQDFVRTFVLLRHADMLFLILVFLYSGFELAFWSGVYGSSLSNTKVFAGDANSLIGVNGMLIGCGEILGGVLFGLLGSKTVKYSRNPIVLIYSILGSLYPDDSAPAFALFRLFQSLASAASFFYSGALVLKWQLLILCSFCFIGSVAFIKVENSIISRKLTKDS